VLAEEAEFPCIVHCTAGKDRTGVLSAIVLSLLGVDDEVIIADYAMSNDSMPRLLEKLMAKFPESAEAIKDSGEMFWADPSNMTGLLQSLRDEHGSIEAYAHSIGLGPEVVARLRQRLLDD
jgi:protein-tyrosine phosphatase